MLCGGPRSVRRQTNCPSPRQCVRGVAVLQRACQTLATHTHLSLMHMWYSCPTFTDAWLLWIRPLAAPSRALCRLPAHCWRVQDLTRLATKKVTHLGAKAPHAHACGASRGYFFLLVFEFLYFFFCYVGRSPRAHAHTHTHTHTDTRPDSLTRCSSSPHHFHPLLFSPPPLPSLLVPIPFGPRPLPPPISHL